MNLQKVSLFLLRLSLGWLFFYAGITKILDPDWSAAGYLSNAKTFPGLFQWFAQPDILPFINFVNEWGLTLIGVALILGVVVRLASLAGAGLMLLYYFPVLEFPMIGTHAYVVDEHIIYLFALLVVGYFEAGRVWGLAGKIKTPTWRRG